MNVATDKSIQTAVNITVLLIKSKIMTTTGSIIIINKKKS